MNKKLVRFMLSFAALTPLLMSTLPASAQTSSSKMQNTPTPGAMMSPKTGSVTTTPHSSLPSSQMPSASGNGKLSRYSPASAPVLKIGSQGKAVKDIQAFLKREKLYTAPVDGIFGRQTRSAVKAFQQSQNLGADGLVGSNDTNVASRNSG